MGIDVRGFFLRGGVKNDVWKFSRGGVRVFKRLPNVLAVFQTYFSDFRDENSQPYFLAVFKRILGLEGGGQRPLDMPRRIFH